jgi:hypothetical protein
MPARALKTSRYNAFSTIAKRSSSAMATSNASASGLIARSDNQVSTTTKTNAIIA